MDQQKMTLKIFTKNVKRNQKYVKCTRREKTCIYYSLGLIPRCSATTQRVMNGEPF